jgi:hypothetical protein
MTRIVSLRIPVRKLAEVDRRAADAGLDRTGYLLRLLETGIARVPAQRRRQFKSKHLLGRFKSSGSSNDKVRAAMKNAADEKNR